MRLRTFTASSMPKAFALVKAELGDDAIILSTEERKGEVHITAAIEPDAQPASRQPSPRQPAPSTKHHSSDQLRYELQAALRFHSLPELFISKLQATLDDATLAYILGQGRMNIANENRHFLKLALEHACGKYFHFAPLPAMPARLMVVGSPGIGKTLAIAKLATRAALAGEKAVAVTTDTMRAGGAQQLKAFTDILGVPMTLCADKKTLAATLRQVSPDAHVLIDTAGCNPFEQEELRQLSSLAQAAQAALLLALPAGMDAGETLDLAEAFLSLPVAGIIATRTDCARRFGGLLATAAAYKLPFMLESGSASAADSVAAMSAKTLVQHLIKPL